jgi:RNA polymerase sigma-70 factor, ECF subfamily
MTDKSGKARFHTGRNASRPDPEILDLIRGGDTQAFEEIVLKYQDIIYNLCKYMTGSAREAEDITQDTFVKAYRNLEKFREGSFSSWLYRIAVNGCLDYRRRPILDPLIRTSRDGEEYSVEPRSDTPTPEESLQSKQASLAVERGLSSLSGKLKAVIVLVEIEGLSYEEVSEVLGISVGTVKSRLSRAREELRRRLKRLTEQK